MPTRHAAASSSALMRSTRTASAVSASGMARRSLALDSALIACSLRAHFSLPLIVEKRLQNDLRRHLVARTALRSCAHARLIERSRGRLRGEALVRVGDGEPEPALKLSRKPARTFSQRMLCAVGVYR